MNFFVGKGAWSGSTLAPTFTRSSSKGVQARSFRRDTLGRPLTIDYSDATPSAWYGYDQGANGIGRVSLAANANASTSYAYDMMGRVTQTQKTVGGMLFTLSASYNYAGLPTSTTLPDGTVITDSYDRMGRLTQVTSDRVDATHPAVLASNFVYHSNGTAASVDWGNGTVTEQTLNENHQLKTLRHGPASDSGQFLDLEYDYDEGSPTRDASCRLSTATTPRPWITLTTVSTGSRRPPPPAPTGVCPGPTTATATGFPRR